MDLDALRHFLHLSRSLHFAQTSRECHLSPSALSREIQRLERELGAKLLRRDNRKVELTPEGVRVQRYASELLPGWDRIREELRAAERTIKGRLTLFCSVTAAHSFLPTLLSRFRNAYPEVTIRLETGDALSALDVVQRDQVDASVAALPERVPATLATHVIGYTPLLFVAPRAECEVSRMVEREPIAWAEVPIIVPQSGLARQSLERWFRKQRIAPRVYGEVSGNEAALSLISLGCGVGIVPGLVLEKSPLAAQARTLHVHPRLPDFRLAVCVKRKNLASKVLRAFWESISDARFGTSA